MLSSAELPVQREFGTEQHISFMLQCVLKTDSGNSDNSHQSCEMMGVRECAGCVRVYKPVSGLALLFPSVVSGIKKTRGEKSV